MPSFLSSTLSLAFLICVLATIVMIFIGISPNQVTFGVITAVVAAYLARYGTPKPPEGPTDTTTITTSTTTPKEIDTSYLEFNKLDAYDPTDK